MKCSHCFKWIWEALHGLKVTFHCHLMSMRTTVVSRFIQLSCINRACVWGCLNLVSQKRNLTWRVLILMWTTELWHKFWVCPCCCFTSWHSFVTVAYQKLYVTHQSFFKKLILIYTLEIKFFVQCLSVIKKIIAFLCEKSMKWTMWLKWLKTYLY